MPWKSSWEMGNNSIFISIKFDLVEGTRPTYSFETFLQCLRRASPVPSRTDTRHANRELDSRWRKKKTINWQIHSDGKERWEEIKMGWRERSTWEGHDGKKRTAKATRQGWDQLALRWWWMSLCLNTEMCKIKSESRQGPYNTVLKAMVRTFQLLLDVVNCRIQRELHIFAKPVSVPCLLWVLCGPALHIFALRSRLKEQALSRASSFRLPRKNSKGTLTWRLLKLPLRGDPHHPYSHLKSQSKCLAMSKEEARKYL